MAITFTECLLCVKQKRAIRNPLRQRSRGSHMFPIMVSGEHSHTPIFPLWIMNTRHGCGRGWHPLMAQYLELQLVHVST